MVNHVGICELVVHDDLAVHNFGWIVGLKVGPFVTMTNWLISQLVSNSTVKTFPLLVDSLIKGPCSPCYHFFLLSILV